MKNFSNNAKITLVLIVTFVIMVAALMYNPQETGENDLGLDDCISLQVTVHGTVTDGKGTPLNDADVWTHTSLGDFSAKVDESGSYVLVLNTIASPIQIIANCDGHCGEVVSIRPSLSNASFEENFKLFPNQNFTLPLGIASIVDASKSSTRCTLHVNLTSGYYDLKEIGSGTAVFLGPFYNLTCDVPVESGPTALYMNVSMRRCYDMESGAIIGMDCASHGPIYGVPINASVPEVTSESWNKSTLNLTEGEMANVTLASKNITYALLANDVQTFSFEFLGRMLTFQEVNMSAGYIDTATGMFVDSSVVAVSMSLVPLTEGNHTYEVFTEDGCMIYIREVTGSH